MMDARRVLKVSWKVGVKSCLPPTFWISMDRVLVGRDGDLAVGFLAQLAAVLTLDTDGVLALLGEAGIVDDEDPRGAGQGYGHDTAIAPKDLLLVPGALVDELLQGL